MDTYAQGPWQPSICIRSHQTTKTAKHLHQKSCNDDKDMYSCIEALSGHVPKIKASHKLWQRMLHIADYADASIHLRLFRQANQMSEVRLTSTGRYFLWKMAHLLMFLLLSLASTMSANSASTSGVPLTRSRVSLARSMWPRFTKLLGVSGMIREPKKRMRAGTMARPTDRRQPWGCIFWVP